MDLIDNNNADPDIAIDDSVKHINEFADFDGIKSKSGACQEQPRKIEREYFIFGNAGNQGDTKKVNGKIKIDIEEMLLYG
jgi:hypothetical protein